MQNEQTQKEISVESREFIVTNFSWNRIGEGWNNILLEVINE